MKKINWEPHYTGICTAQIGPLYLRKDRKSDKLRFIRLSIPRIIPPHYHHNVGIFINQLNGFRHAYVDRTKRFRTSKGIEVFFDDLAIALYTGWKKFTIVYEGTCGNIDTTTRIWAGWFGIKFKTPKWLLAVRQKQREKEDEEFQKHYEEMMKENYGENWIDMDI